MIAKWERLIKKKPWVIGLLACVLALGFAAISQLGSTELETEGLALDTYIPKGQVLIPIIVHNSESVDSIFGSFGVVDLYSVNLEGKVGALPLIRSVKMVRAPKNPSQFGVFVPEEAAAEVVRQGSLFNVVIQNPKTTGTHFEKAGAKPRRAVILESENP
jgi:hypothetical protein